MTIFCVHWISETSILFTFINESTVSSTALDICCFRCKIPSDNKHLQSHKQFLIIACSFKRNVSTYFYYFQVIYPNTCIWIYSHISKLNVATVQSVAREMSHIFLLANIYLNKPNWNSRANFFEPKSQSQLAKTGIRLTATENSIPNSYHWINIYCTIKWCIWNNYDHIGNSFIYLFILNFQIQIQIVLNKYI